MGQAQSEPLQPQNQRFDVRAEYPGNAVIVTFYEAETHNLNYLKKQVKEDCELGDVDFHLILRISGIAKRLNDRDIVDLINGRIPGISLPIPTIEVEFKSAGGADSKLITPPRTHPTTPVIGSPINERKRLTEFEFPAGTSFDLMLSYQWDSQEKVRRIYDDLVASGYSVWMDLDQMHGDIYKRMAEAVKNSKIFAPCLTLNYSRSNNCLSEIEYARTLQKLMVPNLLWKPSPNAPVSQTFAEIGAVGLMTAGLLFVDFAEVEPNDPKWQQQIETLKRQIARRLSDGPFSNVPHDPENTPEPDLLKDWLKPVDFVPDLKGYAESYVSGTRYWLLDRISSWIEDPQASQVMWLRGGAGVGKSVMAWFVGAHLSNTLPEHTRHSLEIKPPTNVALGAQFYCKFNDSLKNDPHRIVESIAYQLSLSSKFVKEYLTKLHGSDLKSKQSLLESDIVNKFNQLLLEPLRILIDSKDGLSNKVVIILDALDECGYRQRLLSALANSANNAPKNLKLLITGRPEPDIYATLQDIHCTELRPTDAENLMDMKMYARKQLSTYLGTNKLLLHEAVDQLSAAADGIFVWMRLACDLIRSKSPKTETETMLIISAQGQGVDSMYHQLLENALVNAGGSDEMFRHVFGIVCVLREPVPLNVLAKLLSIGDTFISAELLRYRFLVEIMSSGGVKFMHKSVGDFLSNSNRCTDIRFFIDVSIYERLIVKQCLDIMRAELHPNMADLSEKNMYDKIPTAVSQKVPQYVKYCCRYWIEHVLSVPEISEDILSRMNELCQKHLMSWAEVMIIIESIQIAKQQLEKLSAQLSTLEIPPPRKRIDMFTFDSSNANLNPQSAAKYIQSITSDLARLFEYYVYPFSRSPLQLYYTGLAFCPTETELWRTYKILLQEVFPAVHLTIGRELTWSPQLWVHQSNKCLSLMYSPDGNLIAASTDRDIIILDVRSHSVLAKLVGHSERVKSVTWSSDSTKVASGSWDKTVRIWSAINGEQLLKMTHDGHYSSVNSVAWSKDGTMVLSGSDDRTLRVWSATTGKELMKIKGHDHRVISAAWSIDGTKIVSGSYDYTVKVWSAATGEQLMVHKASNRLVNSVAWSNDGTKVVYGSSDTSITILSATTGMELMKLNGHSDSIESVAWSTDGTRIASGSSDKTVRIWSASTGEEILKLEGHSSYVKSVCWSNDGSKVVSGSDDSVRIWSTTIGDQTKKLDSHQGHVLSVEWTKDARRIVSGSFDRTVRVWSTLTGEQLMKLEGHEYAVNTVAWSNDETKIASGSDDDTVRIWSAITGNQLLKLEGHINSVNSVSWPENGITVLSKSHDTEILWSASTGLVLSKKNVNFPRNVNRYSLLRVDRDGWGSLSGKYFWLSAEMRGKEHVDKSGGVCIINESKLYCLLA